MLVELWLPIAERAPDLIVAFSIPNDHAGWDLMATVITNGRQTIRLYQSSNRGKPLYQLAYYLGGRR